MKKLKIVFFGTPDFAVPSLEILISNGYDVAAVVTAADKPAGRGLKMHISAVRQYALLHGLKIIQPASLKSDSFASELRDLNADLFIIVAFRMLPEKIWKLPRLGTFNLHASLLPSYRGAAPISHAIMNGETETGITTFFLQHEIDTGDILFRQKIPIGENENAGDLHDRMKKEGAVLVLQTVRAIESGSYTARKQEDFLDAPVLKKAPKISKADCRIDWKKNIEDLHNQVRGLSPLPGAYTVLEDESGKKHLLKIFATSKEFGPVHGKIITDSSSFIKIAGINGYLSLSEVQMEGRKRMKIRDFLRGTHVNNHWKTEE